MHQSKLHNNKEIIYFFNYSYIKCIVPLFLQVKCSFGKMYFNLESVINLVLIIRKTAVFVLIFHREGDENYCFLQSLEIKFQRKYKDSNHILPNFCIYYLHIIDRGWHVVVRINEPFGQSIHIACLCPMQVHLIS